MNPEQKSIYRRIYHLTHYIPHPKPRLTDEQRLEKAKQVLYSRINPIPDANGCLYWTASKNAKGYGAFTCGGKHYSAHRFAYELAHGPIPDNLKVLHTCDHPSCCNPDHLFLGTDQDNKNDMIAKDRQCIGEKHGNAALTNNQVIEIRALYRTGQTSCDKLAAKFGVSKTTIHRIVIYKQWKHLP